MANFAAIRIQHARLVEVEALERVHSRELDQAAEIQRGLLPRVPPVFAGLDLAGYNLQCRTVGGDYFDYLPYVHGNLAVAGWGVARQRIDGALRMGRHTSPTHAIKSLGGEICRDPGRELATSY